MLFTMLGFPTSWKVLASSEDFSILSIRFLIICSWKSGWKITTFRLMWGSQLDISAINICLNLSLYELPNLQFQSPCSTKPSLRHFPTYPPLFHRGNIATLSLPYRYFHVLTFTAKIRTAEHISSNHDSLRIPFGEMNVPFEQLLLCSVESILRSLHS